MLIEGAAKCKGAAQNGIEWDLVNHILILASHIIGLITHMRQHELEQMKCGFTWTQRGID